MPRILLKRKRIIAAFLIFFMEFTLLIWPIGWIREDVSYSVDAAGMLLDKMSEEHSDYCQEFVPRHNNLKSIGLFFTNDNEVIGKGDVLILLSDRENSILFQTRIAYNEISYGRFMDIDLDVQLRKGQPYYLSVSASPAEKGAMPSIALSHERGSISENRTLFYCADDYPGELFTRYSYRDVWSWKAILAAGLLCIITALAVAFGLTQKGWVRRFTGAALLLFLPQLLGMRLERLALTEFSLIPVAVKWSIILMYIMELIVFLCTFSTRATIIIISLFWTILYSVNYFVYTYRGVPLKISDFSAVRTALQVVNHYSFRPTKEMAMAWGIMFMVVVLGAQTAVKRRKKTGAALRFAGRLGGAALGVVIAIVVGYQLLYTDFVFRMGFQETAGEGQNNMYQFNGFWIATCIDIQRSRIEEPEGYSVEKAEKLLQGAKQAENSSKELPHIILIMNESFTDLRVLGDLEISQECMPFFYSLNENAIYGYVNSSVLGGGTANSEFEVLTGCCMGLLPSSSYAYQQYINGPSKSMISSMKEAGYTAWSIHPEDKKNWNRQNVYQYLGFDNSLWKEDFQGAEVVHAGISDMETYRRIEELFESRGEDEKLFLFDVTMQNHGGYTEPILLQENIKAVNSLSPEADNFLSLMRESDKAFEQLVHYFESQEEKVIICMFGDHQPKFSDESFYENIYRQTEGLTEEDIIMNQYKTPFIIWANYDIEERRDMDISLNYLGVLLQQSSGVPMSPYFSFLAEQMNDYPVITVNGYVDKRGNYHAWSGTGSEFSDYRILQYNYLFGDTIEWGY